MPRTALLVLLLACAPAGAGPAQPPDPPPFDAKAYVAAHGEEEFRQRIIPLVKSGLPLDDGSARFALEDGAILDRSSRPARRLSAAEVELLLELAKLKADDASPEARKRFADLARRARAHPTLLGGADSTTVAYLDALASGAGDRLTPPADGFLPRRPSVPGGDAPVAVAGAGSPRKRPSVLTPASELPPARAPLLPPSPAAPAPPSASWPATVRAAASAALAAVGEAKETAVKSIRALRLELGSPQPDPPMVDPALPPKERLEKLTKLAAEAKPHDLDKVFKELGAADLAALPGTKAALAAGLDRISAESGKDSAYGWASALKAAGSLFAGRGELDGPTAVRLAETAVKVASADPSAFSATTSWEALQGAKGLNDTEKRRVEAARSALVEKTLAGILASNKDHGPDFGNGFSYFSIDDPPFAGDPRLAVFGKDLLEAMVQAKGEPYKKADRIGDAVGILAKTKTLTPDLAVLAAETLAALPLDPDARSAENQVLATDIPLGSAYAALSADKGAGSAERLKRYEAARAKIAALHLPGALARLAAAGPGEKAEAAGDLASTMFRGEAKVREALGAELKAMRGAPRSKTYEDAPLLFAALVQALGGEGKPLDEKTSASVRATAGALDLLRPPAAGAPADDYDAYLHGVETARNAIRGSRLPEARKKAVLDEFDASFAAAYDAGRKPADPRKAVAKLLTQGKDWLGQEAFKDSLAFDEPGSNTAYQAAIRETAALFLDRAALTDPDARRLSEAARQARLRLGVDAPPQRPKVDVSVLDAELLGAAGGDQEAFARAKEFLSRVNGSEPPPSSAHIYLEAYTLGNMRSTLASLPADDPRRKGLQEAVAAREKSLAEGLVRLDALSESERKSGVGGSRDHTHARTTGLLALSPESVPPKLRGQVSRWLDENGPLAATYTAFSETVRDGEDLSRGGAGRNVLLSLAGYRLAATDAERSKRLAGLETTLHNFARHEPVLRATMHRYMGSAHPHFYDEVGNSGKDALAPYYYPSAIPRVVESFRILLDDPAVRADPARLSRVKASYRAVRDGLMREFDEGGLREPLRRDQPWFYTLLGGAAAEVAALEASHPEACAAPEADCRPAPRRRILSRVGR